MKKSYWILLAIPIILSLVLIFPISGSARATRSTVCILQTNYATDDPSEVWFSKNGTMMHIRGMKEYGTIEPLPDHPECVTPYSSGEIVLTVNFNLDLTTGDGVAYGKSTISPDGIDGTWEGSFQGKLKNFMLHGKSVSQGTGELEGMVQKVVLQQVGEEIFEVHGYILTP